MRTACLLLALLLVAGAFAQGGAGTALEQAQERPTLLGSIAKDWQLYTLMVLMLMVGVIAIAYAVANAFSLPDLKAWADVELGEIFASALVLIFIIGIVLFIDAAVRGTVAPSFPGSCDRAGFCAANIAADYLDSYKEAAFSLQRDILISNLNKAKEATAGNTVGVQDLIYLYITYRFRTGGPQMITVEMYDQLLQNLGAIIGALLAQSFILKFVTLGLAPLAIFIGIIMRSFFLTRKLGGLLLAFGLGFLIVYPLTYALAWFTLDAAVYGAQKGPTGQLPACPEVCMPLSRIVDHARTPLEEVEVEDVYDALYDDCIAGLADVDETGRSVECMGDCVSTYSPGCYRDCDEECIAGGVVPPPEVGGTAEEIAAWEDCIGPCRERENCDPSEEVKEDYCRSMCPVLPQYAEGKEEYCRQDAERRIVEMGTGSVAIESGGLATHIFQYCEYSECGFPIPYHVTDCQMYAGTPDVCNTRLYDPEDPAYLNFDESELVEGCPAECRTLAPMKAVTSEPASCWNRYCREYYTEEELCEEHTGHEYCAIDWRWDRCKEYALKCPSQCMWITTGGYTDPTCPDTCGDLYPDDPQYLWENDQWDQSCVYIIPDVVFEEPERCGSCAFVAEKGLAMKPPMILSCADFCGAPSLKVMAEDPATMTSRVGGMLGPTELISVSKLMIPAYVLPMFNLAVTLMFVIALSPMLGGDIDIPGIMRMIQ